MLLFLLMASWAHGQGLLKHKMHNYYQYGLHQLSVCSEVQNCMWSLTNLESHSWEFNDSSAILDILLNLRNMMFNYLIHKSRPLASAWLRWIQTTASHFLLKIDFNIILQPTSTTSTGIFSFKPLNRFFFRPVQATCSANLTILDFISG
jgi:hypothetical protein